jgi:hypothetical protein
MTSQGEVYGYASPEGELYFDETAINPEHPLHEYTHLWDRAVEKRNPELWNAGVGLMKQISLWNEIANDANYGQKWRNQGISGAQLENLIASEVHSRLVGE